jgi:serine/threonine protein kinase
MGQEKDAEDRLARGPGEPNAPPATASLTILVSEVVPLTGSGPASTASVSALRRLTDLAADVVEEYRGATSRSGETVTGAFEEAAGAVRAASDLQRRVRLVHRADPECRPCGVRVGIARGAVTRRGGVLEGDGVLLAGLAARRAGPAQILISRSVREAIALDPAVRCAWSGTMDEGSGPAREDLFEVLWNPDAPRVATGGGRDLPTTEPTIPETGAIASPAIPAATRDLGTALPTPPSPPAPALIARFEILAPLGSGGMGVVYKARDRETGEMVALKSLRPEVAADATTMERFKNELRLARKITHKNVCRIHDFVRSEGTAYISMELVEGETLRGVLGRFGSMSTRKGVQIARQICSGLAEAHAQGIVHRDLKPENVMIDRHGNVKLMDFGVARSLHSGITTGAGMAIGTPAYMSPEQAEGRPADGRSDVYSLGLILYEMFTGTPAFRGETPIELALKQIRERPAAPRELEADLPEYLEQTILRCLEKSPGNRFQTIAELDQALSRQTLTPWSSTPVAEMGTGEAPAAWFRGKERVLLVLGLVGLGMLAFWLDDMYPASRLRMQIGFDDAWTESRRLVRDLAQVPPATVFVGRKALVWIDGRTQDQTHPSDPTRKTHELSWEFRWKGGVPGTLSEGTLEIDHEGRLRSFRRRSLESGQGPRQEADLEAARSPAAELARSALGFDPARASVRSEKRYDTDGNSYAHFEWLASAPDERGFRTATVDLFATGVRALGTGYSHYIALPVPVHYWTDHLGALLFALLLLAVFLTRTVNVGAARLRRPLVASLVAGIFFGLVLEPLFPGLPGGEWTADVLLGLAYFLVFFFVWTAGEDTLLSRWPQKVSTWIRPRAGHWMSRAAAVSLLRGALWGLALLAWFVPLTSVASPHGWMRLRTFVLEWPHVATWSPALKSLLGNLAVSVVVAIGPIAVWMSVLRRRVRNVTALVVASALGTTFVYHPDLVNVEDFGAHMLLVFLTSLWFAWCFYETDLLGTVTALAVFDGVVEIAAMSRMAMNVALPGCLLAVVVLAAAPCFAVLSLIQAARAPEPGTPMAART